MSILDTGFTLTPKEAEQLGRLLIEISCMPFAYLDVVSNTYDNELQVKLFQLIDSKEVEADTMALLRGGLVPVLTCNCCDNKTSERFYRDDGNGNDVWVCQGCDRGLEYGSVLDGDS